jgi:hypothetical protein
MENMRFYLLKIIADDGREEFQLVDDLAYAEDRYFRAFAAVTQQNVVRDYDGKLVRLVGCYLYGVSIDDMVLAKERVRNHDALRLQSSDDRLCGVPIIIDGLFRTLH